MEEVVSSNININQYEENVDIIKEENVFIRIFFPNDIKRLIEINKTKTVGSILSFCCNVTTTDYVVLYHDGGKLLTKNTVIGDLIKEKAKSDFVFVFLHCEPLYKLK